MAAGCRRPAALVCDDDGALLPRADAALLDGGCGEVVTVLGAAVEETAAPAVRDG